MIGGGGEDWKRLILESEGKGYCKRIKQGGKGYRGKIPYKKDSKSKGYRA